jgi:hypothetical protein
MTRSILTLALVTLLATTPRVVAQERVFAIDGIRIGMSTAELVAVATSRGWSIPTWTDLRGRTFVDRIDYKGAPVLDSLADEVLLETEGLFLDCPTPAGASCAAVRTVRASFAFGRLVGLTLESDRGQEKVFRAFAVAALHELSKTLGEGDRDEKGVHAFFGTYAIDRTKLMAEIDVVRWAGVGRSATGETMPYTARVYAVRTTEKYDYHRPEKGIFLPWGVSRVVVMQAPDELLTRWSSLRKGLQASR